MIAVFVVAAATALTPVQRREIVREFKGLNHCKTVDECVALPFDKSFCDTNCGDPGALVHTEGRAKAEELRKRYLGGTAVSCPVARCLPPEMRRVPEIKCVDGRCVKRLPPMKPRKPGKKPDVAPADDPRKATPAP